MNLIKQARALLREQIANALMSDNYRTYEEIALQHGVTKTTVVNVAKANGLTPRKRGPKRGSNGK